MEEALENLPETLKDKIIAVATQGVSPRGDLLEPAISKRSKDPEKAPEDGEDGEWESYYYEAEDGPVEQ